MSENYLEFILSNQREVSIPHYLKTLGYREVGTAFQQMLLYPEELQRAVLRDILSNTLRSRWGEEKHFADITSVEEYQEKIPLSEYVQYQEAIHRLEEGEQNLLYDGETVMFLASSGSTGVPKYIPESKNGQKAKSMVSSLRRIIKMQQLPELMKPGMKIFAMSNPAEYEKSKGGIPIGSASGQATSDSDTREADLLILPPEFLTLSDIPSADRDYIMLLFAVSQEHMAAIICNNPGHFGILIKRLNTDTEQIIRDLESGTISVALPGEIKSRLEQRLGIHRDRAELLRTVKEQKGEIRAEHIWPDLHAVSCWLGGSVGRAVREIRELLPEDMVFMDCGYGASEGKFNIPVQKNTPAGVAASFGYFFEFLPIGGEKPVCLWEVEDGKSYELIITSYSGLYRYQMHDIVKVAGFAGKTPQLVFECKKSDCLIQGKQTLYSSQLTGLIEAYEAETNTYLRHFEICSQKGMLPALVIEPGTTGVDTVQFADYIRKQLLECHQIELVDVWEMKEGYRDSLFTRNLKKGKTVNQTKLAVFTEKVPPEEFRKQKIERWGTQ